MSKAVLALVLTITSAAAVAQASGQEVAQGDGYKRRIEEHIQEMRTAIRHDLPIITSVRVSVQLRNQHKIAGVVKNGRFVERVDGLDFAPADLKTSGAGIRVWYYDNNKSYIFLPFEVISTYRIGARLTEAQIQEIEKQMERDREAVVQARKEQLAKKQADGERAEKEADQAKKDAEVAKARSEREVEEARLLALLAEFPPEQGWSEEKATEIQLRKVTVGAYPDEKSQRFLEVFPDWQRGLELKNQKDHQPPADQGEAEARGQGQPPVQSDREGQDGGSPPPVDPPSSDTPLPGSEVPGDGSGPTGGGQ